MQIVLKWLQHGFLFYSSDCSSGPPRGFACFMSLTVDSKKLENGPGAMYAGGPSSQAFGVGGQSYCNFLVSTLIKATPTCVHTYIYIHT